MQPQETGSWVPVALSKDLPPGVAMPVRLARRELALWRSQAGRLAAFADRCPHRGMRLSHGFVRGEALSCIYHGWRYGGAGNCLRIPAHPGLKPPAAIRVAAFPVEEAGGVIWVAEGEPAGPSPSLAGYVPLRSLTIQAGLAAVQAAAGGKADACGIIAPAEDGPAAIRLLAAEQGEGQTLVHVLVVEGCGPAVLVAASRTAEALRRKAETIEEQRIAA